MTSDRASGMNFMQRRGGWALAGVVIAAIVGGAMLWPETAPAATVAVTPTTIGDVLAQARDGDVIRLAPGDYSAIQLRNRSWKPAITIEAGDAHMTNVKLTGVIGVHWRGGKFNGEDTLLNGLFIGPVSGDIKIEGADFVHYTRNGMAVSESADVELVGNSFSQMGSDGIDIALSRRVLIEGNRCSEFHPTEKAHPDCVQLWSRPTSPPVADIIISNNVMNGAMQGISAFNHIRNGVDDGGFDRITIIGNDVAISDYYHGIAAYSCRNCLIRDNKVTTLPGANPKIRAWIKVADSDSVKQCANVVSAFPDQGGDRRCKRDVPMAVARQ